MFRPNFERLRSFFSKPENNKNRLEMLAFELERLIPRIETLLLNCANFIHQPGNSIEATAFNTFYKTLTSSRFSEEQAIQTAIGQNLGIDFIERKQGVVIPKNIDEQIDKLKKLLADFFQILNSYAQNPDHPQTLRVKSILYNLYISQSKVNINDYISNLKTTIQKIRNVDFSKQQDY